MKRGDTMDREEYKQIERLDMRMHKYQFRYFRHFMDKADLYKGDPRLVMTVVKMEGYTQAELAKVLCIKPATLTVMLKRMEVAGLIERRMDEKDLRVLRVYSTKEGQEIARRTEEVFYEAVCQIFEGIEEAELTIYKRVLEKIEKRIKYYLEEGK